jgi:internalin A
VKDLDLSVPWDDSETPKLTELPESLGQLTQLRKLNLGCNRLRALPEWLGQLTQLQKLDLTDNQLTALPESLGQLTQLQRLDLVYNELTTLPEWLGQLTQLRSLDLMYNQLTALPEWLGQLTQLRSLDLMYNQLTALPEWLGQLTQLQWLVLTFNQLTALPESLGQLTQLQTLYLSGNQLTALPEWLGQLTQLQKLDLAGNRIGSLPACVGNLVQLEELNVAICALSDLPETLANLQYLRRLNLEGNPLPPELAAAYGQGVDAVRAYLREKAKGIRLRYEAKLLILGDGNEGKTCVSRALRGLPFEKQLTTRGVDVEPWTFPHPDHPDDENRQITLNLGTSKGRRSITRRISSSWRPIRCTCWCSSAAICFCRTGPSTGWTRSVRGRREHRWRSSSPSANIGRRTFRRTVCWPITRTY